jgi:hypothetical protein
VVWLFTGIGGGLNDLATHGVWFGVDAGLTNFFAHHFFAEGSHVFSFT